MTYRILLWTFGAVAIAIVPLLTIVYRLSTIRRRADNVRIRLWDKDAIITYLGLFSPGDPRRLLGNVKDDQPKTRDVAQSTEEARLHANVMGQFLAVHSGWRYGLGISLLTFVVAITVVVCLMWADLKLRENGAGPVWKLGSTYVMALAGAYVWCVYEILSRMRTRDLTPDDLSEMTLRFVAAVPVGHAFSLLSNDIAPDAFAFIAAAFPLREVRLFLREWSLKKVGAAPSSIASAMAGGRVTDGHIGRTIDGISDGTVAALQDAGYATYMDLAYADPIRVTAIMGYPLRLVLAWIDQCLLAVYAPALKGPFARAGIPCALDAAEFFKDHCLTGPKDAWRTDTMVLELAKKVELAPELLYGILERVHADPHVEFLGKVWRTNLEATREAAKTETVPGRPLPAPLHEPT